MQKGLKNMKVKMVKKIDKSINLSRQVAGQQHYQSLKGGANTEKVQPKKEEVDEQRMSRNNVRLQAGTAPTRAGNKKTTNS